MREWMLNSPKAKTGKDGSWYMAIPFRHMGPKATGRYGQPLGSQFRAMLGERGAMALGRKIDKLSKKLKESERLPSGLAPKLKSHHVTDIYAGMKRQVQQYRSASQSQRTTFRTISEKSDPKAWQHPGIEARELFKEAEDYIDRVSRLMLKG